MQGGMTSAVPFWPVMKDLIAGFKLSRAGVLSFLKPTLGWPTAVVCEAPVYLGVLFENQFEAVKKKMRSAWCITRSKPTAYLR